MNLKNIIYTQGIQQVLQVVSRNIGLTLCKPSFFSLRVTYKCNLRCKHCSAWKIKDTSELSTEQWKQIISDIRKWTNGSYLIFGGGEPLLRRDIFEVINSANDSGLYTMIMSNGCVNKSMAKRLAKGKIDFIKISMDGCRETHDNLRGVKGAYKKIENLIKILNQNNKKVMINMILSEESQKDTEQIFKFVNYNNLFAIEFQPVFPDRFVKNSRGWYKESELWPKDMKEICNSIDKIIHFKKKGFPVLNSIKHLQLMKDYFKNPNQKFINSNCNSLYQKVIINPNGDIKMCNKYLIGNLQHEAIEKIWHNKKVNRLRKKMMLCKKNCLLFNCNYGDSIFNKFNKFRIFFKIRL